MCYSVAIFENTPSTRSLGREFASLRSVGIRILNRTFFSLSFFLGGTVPDSNRCNFIVSFRFIITFRYNALLFFFLH